MKKYFIILGFVLFIFLGFLFIRFFLGGPEDAWICEKGEWTRHGNPASATPTGVCQQNKNNSKQIIGGQKDEHDCLGPAGYQWCPSNNKCQRMWEEYCEEFKDVFKITDFNSCVAAGNAVMESYPRQCRANGENFTEGIGNELEKTDLIKLDNPRPNQKIKSPLAISGQARGNWYFEGSFPISLVNWDGLIIAEGQAKAQSDWMTEDFVPFTASLEFVKPDYKNNGALILQKDNPSGLPVNDDALEIPVIFE